MNEQDMALAIAKYGLENWSAILALTTTAIIALVTGTWFIARHWYSREIRHCKAETEANDKLHSKEVRHLTRQLQDKDAYANGVMENMSQRLQGAQEETGRYLKIVQQHEQRLLELSEKNDALLAQGQEARKSNGTAKMWSHYDLIFIIDEMDRVANFNLDMFPNDKHSHFISHEIKFFRKSSKDDLTVNGVAGLMLYLLKSQSQKMAELDIGLARCDHELNETRADFIESILKIMEPLASRNSSENEAKKPSIKLIEFSKKKSHLDWAFVWDERTQDRKKSP